MPTSLSFVFLLLAMTSIQVGASVAKSLFPILGPMGVTSIRVFFAAVILLVLFRPWRLKLERRVLAVTAFYGIALGSMNLLFYLALERIPLGIAVALEFTGPLAVALLMSRRKLDLLWAFLAALGIWFVLPHQSPETSLDLIGILYALGAGVCWAAYILFGQRAGQKVQGASVTALGMSFAALVTCPFGVAEAGMALLDWSILPLGILVAILSSALPYSLEMMTLRKMPAKTFGILMSLEPAIAALAGLVFLKEQLSALQWGAILCVIVASLGSSLTVRKANPTI